MENKVIFRTGSGVHGADLLILEGHQDIRNIQALKKSILGKISQSHALEVRVRKAEKLDYSLIQLLAGVKLKFTEEQKDVFFDIDAEEDNKRVLRASGFGDFLTPKI